MRWDAEGAGRAGETDDGEPGPDGAKWRVVVAGGLFCGFDCWADCWGAFARVGLGARGIGKDESERGTTDNVCKLLALYFVGFGSERPRRRAIEPPKKLGQGSKSGGFERGAV